MHRINNITIRPPPFSKHKSLKRPCKLPTLSKKPSRRSSKQHNNHSHSVIRLAISRRRVARRWWCSSSSSRLLWRHSSISSIWIRFPRVS